ncbi:MAG: 60S ribosomal protein L31 [archaeon]|nr:60S ribosomal protein L31 [archaeon]
MKGEQANYVIPLRDVFDAQPKKRIRKALTEIQRFAKKHTRAKEIAISNEVNEKLHAHSKNIPRRINATLRKEETRVIVFLEGGKELAQFLAKKDATKKKKKDEEAKKKETKKEDAEKTEDDKKKLEEKKAREDAARASEIKRKTGN